MKFPAIPICLLSFFMTTTLYAKPIIILLDVDDPEHLPSRYGYTISCIQKADISTFVFHMDDTATKALIKPSIFASTTASVPPIKLTTTEKKDGKEITFSVPTKSLGAVFLQIRSAPIPKTNTPEVDFYAYRIRLENIKTEPALPANPSQH